MSKLTLVKHGNYSASLCRENGQEVIHLTRVALEGQLSLEEWTEYLERMRKALETAGRSYEVERIWHGWLVNGEDCDTLEKAHEACREAHLKCGGKWGEGTAAACLYSLSEMKNGETITINVNNPTEA
jgi:hypothetical protein